jgi:hypothetical protein
MPALVAACGGGTASTPTPAATPVSTATAAPTPDLVAEAMKQEWTIAQSGTGAFVNGRNEGFTALRTPMFKAEQILVNEGWKINSLWMGSDEEVLQAVISGSAHFANTPFSTVLAAHTGGADLKMFSAISKLDFIIVGDAAITGCEDMDDKTVAVQGPVTSGALAARLFLGQCGSAGTLLTIQGQANRTTALLADETDAIASRLGGEIAIEEQAPGQYRILYEPLISHPFLIDLTVSFSASQCDQLCKVFAQRLTAEQVKIAREAIADPSVINDWIAEYNAISSDERAAGLLFPDAGITISIAEQIIQVLADNGQLPEGVTLPAGGDVVDESIWQAIAAELG